MSASPGTRVAFGLAAAVAATALALHAALWWRIGAVDWPIAANIGGLLLLTAVGAVDPPRGRSRTALGVAALLLVFPSAALLWMR